MVMTVAGEQRVPVVSQYYVICISFSQQPCGTLFLLSMFHRCQGELSWFCWDNTANPWQNLDLNTTFLSKCCAVSLTLRGTWHDGFICNGGLAAQSYPTLMSPWMSMGFPRQEYWSGLLGPSPGDFPDPGIEPRSPALWVDSLPTEPPGKPYYMQ